MMDPWIPQRMGKLQFPYQCPEIILLGPNAEAGPGRNRYAAHRVGAVQTRFRPVRLAW